MAEIIGVINTTHVPAIAHAIVGKKNEDPYWKPFFDGFHFVHKWVEEKQPTTVVMFYNDHGLNFFLDKMPTFAIGCAPHYRPIDEGWGIDTFSDFEGNEALSWHIANSLKADEFDMVTCQEYDIDHSVTIPMELIWPGVKRPVKLVPIDINTVLFPTPTAARCLKLGRAAGKAIESFPGDERILVIGTGGLSHQLEGLRAGFINKKYDLEFIENLPTNPEWAAQFSPNQIVEYAGTQGMEMINWVAARGTIAGDAKQVHMNYHIPISNTASCVMVMEKA